MHQSVNQWTRRILVVDDDVLTTTLVRALLEGSGFDVETCHSAIEARAHIESFDPDLVLLDVNLGGGPTGVQLSYAWQRLFPGVALLYFTRYPTALMADLASHPELMSIPVLSKDSVHDSQDLVAAIDEALRGRGQSSEEFDGLDAPLHRLTRTQWRVLELVASGLTNAAIAQERQTSERAVEKQLKLIYETLGLVVNGDHNPRVQAALRYTQSMGVVQRSGSGTPDV